MVRRAETRAKINYSLQTLLHDEALRSNAGSAHTPSLVVEVGEDDLKTLVLFAKGMLIWNKDILKGDVGSARSGRVGGLDGFGLNTLAALDEKNNESALLSAAANGEIVCKGSIGDPLLGSIHDPAFVNTLGAAAKTSNIATSKGLGNG